MAAAASASESSRSGRSRYAPPDPTLPKPWRALVDGSTGFLYFWNPETKVTQYERPPSQSQSQPETQLQPQPQPQRQPQPQPRPRPRSPPSAPQPHQESKGVQEQPHSSTRTTPLASGPSASGLSPQAYRTQHEITVIGSEVPAPYMTFQSTGFPTELLREIHQAGFSTPTPIQAQSWPIALQGRDIVAVAKTGSGKTLGYLIPGFILLKRLHHNSRDGPMVLVLSPTRELATQIQDEAMKFGKSSRISSACLYGGAPKGPQLKDLDRGADVVVATPGRLNDILEMRRVSLHQVSYLVLDEADRMLDMGFEPQIRKIVNQVPPRRQTLMFTATWPKEVRKIAADLLRNPVQVNIGNTDQLVANKSITQYVEVITSMEKPRRLDQILRSQGPGSKVIIFCSTKRMCDQLARNLSRQYSAAAIHGDKSQAERDSVLNEFRSGRSPILVATDVAARGLDIKDIRAVVNYDFPTGVEDYVHRIGRTGRAGATGAAYTFFCDQDSKYASDLIKILEGASQSVPPQLQDMARRGGYGGRSRRWGAASDQDSSYSTRGYDSSYANRPNDEPSKGSFHNSTSNNESSMSSFHNSTSHNQSGDGLSFHARFYSASKDDNNGNSSTAGYGAGGRDQDGTRSQNRDGSRSRSRSPGGNSNHAVDKREEPGSKSEAVGITTW